jgi:hypothetical protein
MDSRLSTMTYGESPTPRITDTESFLYKIQKWFPVLVTWGVDVLPYFRYGDSIFDYEYHREFEGFNSCVRGSFAEPII